MNFEYKKSKPIKLRNAGKDEKWLQDRINEDPSILGLGDLVVLQRERSQPSGGRIDFLMYHPDEEVRYEIEVMLGTLDESHIIRTIEYWDIEKRRYPNIDHRAVIVAEDITNRFFNVISILNKAVPIIAIQLSSNVIDNNLIMDFVKVLDLVREDAPEDEAHEEQVDRKYWDGRSNEKSLKIMDKLIGLVSLNGSKPKVTYNKGHVALGTTGNNFMWFHPRKSPSLRWSIKVGVDKREDIKNKLVESGVEALLRGSTRVVMSTNDEDLKDEKNIIIEAIKIAEKYCEK